MRDLLLKHELLDNGSDARDSFPAKRFARKNSFGDGEINGLHLPEVPAHPCIRLIRSH